MEIGSGDLLQQAVQALQDWPFILEIERTFNLPMFLLLAVGSRETNLTNEVGDGGHGHGVWQLDNRSHVIPAGFDGDVNKQAAFAATELVDNFIRAHDWRKALNMYNSGQTSDAGTAHGNYGIDVLERMNTLQVLLKVEENMPLTADDVNRIAEVVIPGVVNALESNLPTILHQQVTDVVLEEFQKPGGIVDNINAHFSRIPGYQPAK